VQNIKNLKRTFYIHLTVVPNSHEILMYHNPQVVLEESRYGL